MNIMEQWSLKCFMGQNVSELKITSWVKQYKIVIISLLLTYQSLSS